MSETIKIRTNKLRFRRQLIGFYNKAEQYYARVLEQCWEVQYFNKSRICVRIEEEWEPVPCVEEDGTPVPETEDGDEEAE